MKNSIVWDYFLLINKYTDCQYLSALQMQTSPVYYPQALSLVSCTLHCFSSKAHMKWCLRHRISQPKSVSPQVQGYRITQGTTHSLLCILEQYQLDLIWSGKGPVKQSCQHNNFAKELKCSWVILLNVIPIEISTHTDSPV